MAGTNPNETVVDDDKEVTADDLRDLKYGGNGVEDDSPDDADETTETEEESDEASEDDGQTDDQATDETDEADTTAEDEESAEYVKKFPNIKGETLEDYARGLEAAYENSTAEAMRLKGLVDKPDAKTDKTDKVEIDTSDPVSLYMKQKMDEEITGAFKDFQTKYPQVVPGTAEYAQFTQEVAALSQTILNSQGRLAPPQELYSKAAVILGWEPTSDKPDSKEKLGIALKTSAAVSKTNSAKKSTSTKSKVTDAMIAVNRAMYPGKSVAEIRTELEPYVN